MTDENVLNLDDSIKEANQRKQKEAIDKKIDKDERDEVMHRLSVMANMAKTQKTTPYNYRNYQILKDMSDALDPWYIDHLLSIEDYSGDTTLYNWLRKIGSDLLKVKNLEIGLANLDKQARMKDREVTAATTVENAVLIVYLLPWANILMSDTSNDSLLGLYMMSGELEGTYTTDRTEIDKVLDRVCTGYNTLYINETRNKITRMLDSSAMLQVLKPGNKYTPVNNGLFNHDTKMLEPFTPDKVFTTKRPINYVPNAVAPLITMPDGVVWDFDSWLMELSNDDPQIEKLHWEVLSVWVKGLGGKDKSIWWYSVQGNNGKGTLALLYKNLLGVGNYSTLNIQQLGKEFLIYQLANKSGNIGDENSVNMYIDDVSGYKSLITGDAFTVNVKREQPFTMKFQGTDIQILNTLPKTKDKTDSFYRRFEIVPFTKSYTNNGERKYIKSEYMNDKAVLEYVMSKSLNYDDFDSYTTPDVSAKLLTEFKGENNPVVDFCNEMVQQTVWDAIPTKFLYTLFVSWSRQNNSSAKVQSSVTFNRDLTAYLRSLGDDSPLEHEPRVVKSTTMWNDDEPLITEYGIADPAWTHPTNFDPQRRRNFDRKPKYTCWVKL